MIYQVVAGVSSFIYNNTGAQNASGDKLSNLSQLELLDNGLINFPTGNLSGILSGSPSVFYSRLKERIGDDIDKLYCVNWLRADEMTPAANILKEGIPSLFLLFPETFNRLKKVSSSTLNPCFHLKSLKRLLVTSGSSSNVYRVNDDGSLSFIGNTGDGFYVGFSSGETTYYLYNLVVFKPGIEFNAETAQNGNNWSKASLISSTSQGGVIGVDTFRLNANFALIFGDFAEPDGEGPINPYEPGGPSGEGGGNGTFDGDSDQIPDSSLPTLSAADTGFTRLYTPTLSQVQSLARYLWTDESIIDTLWNVVKRYFEDPMQAFISFSIVPVPVPIAGQEEFKVLFIPTGVMLNTVANQFVDVDCGTFEMKEYYGSALDYSPNTKVSCYLPYIGTVSLNTDDVMGRTLQVKYRVDICSGSCVAKILVDGNVIYQFPGCCSIPIPFSSSDFSSYGSAIISAVKTGVAVAAAGAGMPELGASIVGMNGSQQTGETYTKTTTTTERNPATGRQITMGTQKVTKEVSGTKASLEGIAQVGIANTANAVTASKTIVERSGSFSGNSGYLGVRRPYLIIERPRMCMPSNYQALNGFPSMITMELSSCKGYTRVQQVQLTGMDATNPEQAEILQLLKGGVIF